MFFVSMKGGNVERPNAHLRVPADRLGLRHTVDSGTRPTLRDPPPSVATIAECLYPAAPHASATVIERRRHRRREAAVREATAKLVRSETAASERIIKEGIRPERSVKVSKYRVEQDEWVCEAPWARSGPEPEPTKRIHASTTEEGIMDEGIAEERFWIGAVGSVGEGGLRSRGRRGPDAVLIVR